MLRVLALTVALTACAGQAHEPVESPDMFSAEAVRADLDVLYEGLQRAHYDLYVHTPKAEYDRIYQRTRLGIDRPMTRIEAQVQLQRFAAAGRVAHATLDFPSEAFSAFRERDGRIFPLSVRIEDARLYVAQNLSGATTVAAGDEVLRIDGRPTREWLDRARQYISADTDYLAWAQIEPIFGAWLWLELGETDAFEVSLRRADGAEATVRLPARTRAEMRVAAESAPPGLDLDYTQRIARMLPNGIAYLRPGIFLNVESEDAYDTHAFHAFIDAAFAQFIAGGATALLIDLRDNPGGDNSFSDHMIAWFADRPFRFASTFRIRVSPEATASNQARLATAGPDSSSRQLAALYAGAATGNVVILPVPMVEPRAGTRFEGHVFVLVNRRSFSNSVLTAAIVQDHGLGRVLGEPTSDLATTYGAAEHFTLPNTGLRVAFPKAHIVRPSGDERVQGVTPDIAVDMPIMQGADDPVLQEALRIVTAERR